MNEYPKFNYSPIEDDSWKTSHWYTTFCQVIIEHPVLCWRVKWSFLLLQRTLISMVNIFVGSRLNEQNIIRLAILMDIASHKIL